MTPVLCFIGQAVPSGAERIAGVQLFSLDHLMTLVSVGGAPLDDVECLARLARTPTPVRRPKPPPTGSTSAPAPSSPSTGCAGRPLAIIAAIVGLLVL